MHFRFKNLEQKESFIGRQSFSGTDLDKDEKEAGIVYPYDYKEEIKDGVTSSSIIDLHNTDDELLKHTEVRVCNTIDKEKIQYDKLETASIVIDENKDISLANRLLFGIKNDNNTIEGYIESKDKINVKPLLEIMKIYKEFEHTFTFIDSENIKEKQIINYSPMRFNKLEKGLFEEIEQKDKQYDICDNPFEEYVIDDNTPEDIKERFERLTFGSYDFEYISMEDIDEFHNFFIDNREMVKASFLESFIMDSYAYDCTNQKQVNEFKSIFGKELKKEDLSILTDYILEKLEKYREKINEDNKSDYLQLF